MKTTMPGLLADTPPNDIIFRVICKLDLLNHLITNTPGEEGPIVMSTVMRDGFYFTFTSLSEELKLALGKLEGKK